MKELMGSFLEIFQEFNKCGALHDLVPFLQFKKRGGLLLLVKLQAEASNFTKSNTSFWVIFMFFKFYKWYQIAQRTTNTDFNNRNTSEDLFLKLTRDADPSLTRGGRVIFSFLFWLYLKFSLSVIPRDKLPVAW